MKKREIYTPLFELVTDTKEIRYQGKPLYDAPPELVIDQKSPEEALAFAKWPNPAVHDDRMGCVQLMDGIRLRSRLDQRGVMVEREAPLDLDEPYEGDDRFRAVCDYVQTYGTTAFTEVRRKWLATRGFEGSDDILDLREQLDDLLATAWEHPSISRVAPAARKLERLLFGQEEGSGTGEGESGAGDSESGEVATGADVESGLDVMEGYANGHAFGHDREWGTMKVVKPDRERSLPPRLRAPQATPRTEGAIPRAMHRFTSDMAIFASKTRRPNGATVLIDRSGSMSLDPDEVRQLMEALPASIVAAYSAQAEHGELHVLAAKGRRVTDLVIKDWNVGNGNVIDGPALAWLGKQPGPRLWVCDGAVTGVDDDMAGNLIREAMALCRKHRIVRVGTLEDALGYVKRKRMAVIR